MVEPSASARAPAGIMAAKRKAVALAKVPLKNCRTQLKMARFRKLKVP